MFAAAVIAVSFTGILVVTWLASRAEEAKTRCDEHRRRIERQLEIPPVRPMAPRRPPRPPAPG
ncbi:MAG TPA: hypothetical protein VNQ33_04765 [Acidimicrobiales bacterium]|nr:hypothetical protein [Acidimicrobiales bacterium]